MPIREIKKCLDYKLHQITACLLSHNHGDHAKGAKDLMKCGIDLFCSRGTSEALGLSGHRLHILEDRKQVQIGKWDILPFKVPHNASDPMAFILMKGNDKVLFATDCLYIPYRFKGLTHIMIETDYDTEILRENLIRKGVEVSVAKNVIRNHMSFKTAKKFFEANDLAKVREIYLLHLSSKNSDAVKFKREIEKRTGIPVYLK